MYDDTNWCLVCNCHFDGPGLYCSIECRNSDHDPSEFDDDEVIYHRVLDAPHSHWTANGAAGIIAWASEIPPANPAMPPRSRSPSKTPSPPHRLPKLLSSNRRPGPPSLMTVTAPLTGLPSPAYPISTPRPQSTFCTSLSRESIGKLSLLSAPTDSSLATPASTVPLGVPPNKPTLLGTLATHVRSWVSPSSPLVASSPLVSRDYPALSPTLVKQHEPRSKHSLLAQRHFDDPDTAWRLRTTILVAEPRSRGRKLSRP